MKKSEVKTAIVERLRSELDLQARAAQVSRDEAISEESKPENKYDTHSQEAAYLAEGQARLALEIAESLRLYETWSMPMFAADIPIAAGALVEIADAAGKRSAYFLGPKRGGLEVTIGGETVLLLTPQSPFGRELLGKRQGDFVKSPGRGASKLQIVAVQ